MVQFREAVQFIRKYVIFQLFYITEVLQKLLLLANKPTPQDIDKFSILIIPPFFI